MSLLLENVMPGNNGKIFGTDAKEMSDLIKIQQAILQIDGIKDVILNTDIFPREITIHTSKLMTIKNIENKLKVQGFIQFQKGFLNYRNQI